MKNKLKLLSNIYLKKDRPVSLIIFLTNRCNARCSFCFIDFDNEFTQDKKNELTLDDYKKLSKSFKKSLHHINFTGGEPFLRSDIGDICLSFIDNADLSSMSIVSNGSYPKKVKKFLDTVCKNRPDVDFIFNFSIDSYPDKHDKIRKIPGLFDKMLESMNFVKNSYKNCIATCNFTITEENYTEVNEIYDYLKNTHKIKTINPIIVRNEGVHEVPSEKKIGLLNAYKTITNKNKENIRKGNMRGFSNFDLLGKVMNAKNEIQYDMISESYLEPKFFAPCTAGSIFGVIYTDGSVYPCEILDKPIGNLHDFEFDFLELWATNKAKETRNWIKDTKCNCHWECIIPYNIVSSPKYASKLITKNIL